MTIDPWKEMSISKYDGAAGIIFLIPRLNHMSPDYYDCIPFLMERSAGLWVYVSEFELVLKLIPHGLLCVCGINSAGITMFYTNLNSADADAKSR